MKIKYIAIAFLFCTCNKSTNHVKLTSLTEIDLYNQDKVYDFVFYSQESDIDSIKRNSQRDFLKGLDLLRNQKKVSDAIPMLKKSVLSFPTAKGYFELGMALRENKSTKEALDAFKIAQKLNYQPNFQIFVERASCYIAENNHSDAFNELRNAYLSDAVNANQMINRADFSDFKITEQYSWLLTEFKEKINAKESDLLTIFLQSFPKVSLPYSIDQEQVTKTKSSQAISYAFSNYVSEMQTSNFGREVNYEFFPVARLWDNEDNAGLVYQQSAAFGEEYKQIFYHLVVVNSQGKKLSSKLLACNCSAEKTKTFSYDGKNILVSEWKRKWEKPITESNFENNSIKGYESIGLVKYEVKKDGQVVEIESNNSRAEN